MADRVREPWTESWNMRDSMMQLGRDAFDRGQPFLSEIYFQAADHLGHETVALIDKDTEQRAKKL